MRILVTSDLHYGVGKRGDAAVRALADWVVAARADVLIVNGDIGADLASLTACLELFRRFDGVKLAVPGNHDVWLVDDPKSDSWTLHEEVLPRTFRAAGFHPLHLEPCVVGDVAFVGSMGWYDYTFRDDLGIPEECYSAKTYPGDPAPMWNDARFARFPWTDEELTQKLATRLGGQLAQTVGARRTYAIVHHLTHKRLLIHPRFVVPRKWRFANAFLGSDRLGDVLRAAKRPIVAICGHVHMRREHREPDVHHVTIGSDYVHKEVVVVEPSGELSWHRFG
jgi:predicted phosphohydrolase